MNLLKWSSQGREAWGMLLYWIVNLLAFVLPTYFLIGVASGRLTSIDWGDALFAVGLIFVKVTEPVWFWRTFIPKTDELFRELNNLFERVRSHANVYASDAEFKELIEGLGDKVDQLGSELHRTQNLAYTGSGVESLQDGLQRMRDELASVVPPRRGRPRGSLSAYSVDGGVTIDDIMPFLIRAKRALDEGDDDLFERLCEAQGHTKRNAKRWLKEYEAEIETAMADKKLN